MSVSASLQTEQISKNPDYSEMRPEFLRRLRTIDLPQSNGVLALSEYDAQIFGEETLRDFGIATPHDYARWPATRQLEFCAGRGLAHQVLSGLSVQHTSVPVGPSSEPLWPQGVSGSLALSTTAVACLVTPFGDALAGVDVRNEHWGLSSRLLVNHTIMPSEEAQVFGSAALSECLAATLACAAKEALFRALFPRVQTYIGFETAEIVKLDRRSVLLRLRQDLGGSFPAGRVFTVSCLRHRELVVTYCLDQ